MTNTPSGENIRPERFNNEDEELAYWLSKTPGERIAEVTRLMQLDLEPGQRMDKTHVVITKLHPDK